MHDRKPCSLQEWIMRTKKNRCVLFLILSFILLLAAICSLCIGSTRLSFSELAAAFHNNDIKAPAYRIFMYIRLPRTLAAVFSGVALTISGVVIQAALNNVLAGPNIIGVNSGSGFFTLLTLSLFPTHPQLAPVGAFFGALICILLIFCLCAHTGSGRLTIILAGVAISSIFSAGIDAIGVFDPELAINASGFMVGGFSGVTFSQLLPAIYLISAVLILILPTGNALNVLLLGDECATGLGMRVSIVRILLLTAAAALAGAAVSFGGLLGFVGLLVPHISRRLFGSDNRILLPASGLCGASFVLFCDILSRVLFMPFELPVGILLSVIGGPFFLTLLLRGKQGEF